MFEPEYITLVIKPKIDHILDEGVESLTELTANFNRVYSCSVPKSRITDWLKAIGYRVSRRVDIARPSSVPQGPPLKASVAEHASVGVPQTPQHPINFNFSEPSGVFANVRMPGFQD